MKRTRTAAAPALAVLLAAAGAAWAAASYWDHLARAESSGNQWATNPNSTATGSYQMTQGALASVGLIKQTGPIGKDNYGNGSWDNVQWQDNPFGVKSRQDFMNNKAAQDWAVKQYAAQNWDRLQKNGGASHVGREINGVKVNEAALLECAHFMGAGGCATYLKTGKLPNGALGNHPNAENLLLRRMADAAQYDASEVTGSHTPGGGSVPGGPIPPGGGSGGGEGLYCNPEIAQMMVDRGEQAVEAKVALAADPSIGHGLLGGGSVIAAAGGGAAGGGAAGGGAAGGVGSPLVAGEASFMELSCLERLLNGGMDIFFRPPSIGDLLGMLESAVCRQADRMFARLTEPLNQSLTQTADLGGFFPGLGLGSLGTGVNSRVRTGTDGPGTIRSNVDAILSGGTGWQGRSTVFTPTGGYFGPIPGGGLFGE